MLHTDPKIAQQDHLNNLVLLANALQRSSVSPYPRQQIAASIKASYRHCWRSWLGDHYSIELWLRGNRSALQQPCIWRIAWLIPSFLVYLIFLCTSLCMHESLNSFVSLSLDVIDNGTHNDKVGLTKHWLKKCFNLQSLHSLKILPNKAV